MNTTTSTGYTYTDTASVIEHAEHIWEEWHAYTDYSDEKPAELDGNASGICCHTCSLIIVESSIY
jgi:hypothetical protein